jgi:ribonucleotide reductase beta subunit family protein with ferritin-like domain
LVGILGCSSLYITDKIKKREEWRTSESIQEYTQVAPELYNGPVIVYNKPGGLCAERLQIIDDDDWKGIPVYLEIAFKILEGLIFFGLFCMRNRRGDNFDVNAR